MTSAPTPSLSDRAWTPLLLFILPVLVLFGPSLLPSTHQVISRVGDLSTQFVWWREFGFGELQKGHLALWNPKLFCGAPFFGGFQSALLYPPNWIFLFLPMAFALNLSMAFHLFLAGAFTYLWAWERGNGRAASSMAGLIFMFSGAFYPRILEGHLSNLCAMPWIPFLLWALEGWRKEGKPGWIAWGAFGLAMQVLSGHPQYVYYTVLFAGTLTLASPPSGKGGRAKALLGFFAMGVVAVLLSAVQLLPGWEASQESVRSVKLSIGVLDMLDLTPERLCTLFMPYFYGGWQDYWGGGIYFEAHLFVTVTGFVLSLMAWRTSKDPDRKLLWGAILFLVVLMVGRRTPLFLLFCKYFPLFDHFRGIGKLNVFMALSVAVLAAGAFEAILRDPQKLAGSVRALGRGSSLFFFLAGLFFAAAHFGGQKLFRQFLPHADSMTWSLLGTGFFLGVLALLCRETPRLKALKWAWWGLVAVECLVFAWVNRSSFDLRALQQKTAILQDTYQKDPGDYRVWMDLANYSLGAPAGLDVWGEDPMMLARYTRFAVLTQGYDLSDDLLRRPFFVRFPPALRLLRWRYDFHEESDGLVSKKTGFREVPRAFLVGDYQVLDEEGALEKAAKLDFDPARTVLLEQAPGFPAVKGPVKGTVTVKDQDSDHLDVTAQVPRPCLLVISDNYSTGWRASARMDPGQKEYQVLPANGFQRALPLDAGVHHFLLEYRPKTFDPGKWISGLAWLFFLPLLFFWGFRPRA